MKRHLGWSPLLGLLVVLSLIGFGVAQQPKPGGALRVAWEADITGFDPHLSPGTQAYYVEGNLFNSLLTIDAELNYVPDLAESWDILENGKIYVFHLRKGVKFHDGTDFDAEVVRWNYQRIMDPEEKALDAPFYSSIESVEVLDAHTVKFTLKHPSMTLLPTMAANRAGFLQMSPASYKQRGKDEVRLHPVGTGPFTLARWEQNQIIVLEKNPLRYTIMTHAGEPSLPTIATILKTQYAKIGVEVMVEVIDRPIFLRRITRDRDWDQSLNLTSAWLDAFAISRLIDTRSGTNTINHQDKQVDTWIDRMQEAPTEEAYRQTGYDFQRYVAENMLVTSVASVPFLQAARASVKDYEHLHGFKIRFETTWLEKP
jgi:ABC-type transport system substrate-binding protein